MSWLRVAATAVSVVAFSTNPAAAQISSVNGFVHDSLHGVPLIGAVVQLSVAFDSTKAPRAVNARTDERGRFRFDSVGAGRYLATFSHALLDSLGLEAPTRVLTVVGNGETVDLPFAVPTARTVIGAICPKASSSDGMSLFMGRVRNASNLSGLQNASLTIRWSEFELSQNGLARMQPAATYRTKADGWFAICNAPTDIELFVQAAGNADTSGVIEVQVPKDGVKMRDVFVGRAERVVDTLSVVVESDDRTSSRAPVSSNVIVRWRGNERVRGHVVDAQRRPIAGAEARLWGGLTTVRTDVDGAFTLVDAPSGTRTLDVRAIGYMRETRAVDVRQGAVGDSVLVSLVSTKSFLDTIRVVAGTAVFSNDASGFERRRRTGVGHFMSRDDISKRASVFTSDLLVGLPQVRVVRQGGENVPLMRGSFGECIPSLFIDDIKYGQESSSLDLLTFPSDVESLEVYVRGGDVPPQFFADGCGAIVVWTSRYLGRVKAPKKK